jgi:S1-C subfamily serine protease
MRMHYLSFNGGHMKKLIHVFLIFMIVLALAGCFDTRSTLPYQSPHEYEQLRLDMISEVRQSVIVVKTDTGHGSGLIYLQEGNVYYAITNQHVVEDAGEMSIHFGGLRDDIPINGVTASELYDVAVVRFESEEQLPVYDSKAINDEVIVEIVVGQDVYAIGTPEDMSRFNYVTQGIVSMNSYPYKGIDNLAIMHDAELNPGNSGGPLFNLSGDFIGINVAKIASVSTADGPIAAEGLNYSLNINEIYIKFLQFVSEEDFTAVERRPRLGVTIQEASVFLENPENDPGRIPSDRAGVVVIGLDETRDAINYLEVYDFIIGMNGNPITAITDIAAELENAQFDDTHDVTVLRKINDAFVEFTFTITLS